MGCKGKVSTRKTRKASEPERRLFQSNPVQEGNPRVVATAGAIETVIENPFFSVLKLDPHITQATRHVRGACLHHDPASPRSKPFVEHLITDFKVNMFLGNRFFWRLPRLGKEVISSLGKVRELGFHAQGIIHTKFLLQN